jgi:hypothetical protein
MEGREIDDGPPAIRQDAAAGKDWIDVKQKHIPCNARREHTCFCGRRKGAQRSRDKTNNTL